MAAEPNATHRPGVTGRTRRRLMTSAALTLLWLGGPTQFGFAAGPGSESPAGWELFARSDADATPNITFASIAAAETTLAIRTEQVRRVLETGADGERWVGIREALTTVPGANGAEPRFVLDYIGMQTEAGVDEPPVSTAELLRRQQVYRSQAAYLHLHASLRISDPLLAAQNYVIVYVDATTRIDRPAHRIAILPRRLGRNPWLLEVDAATGFPLFRAEFDATGRVVSTLEVSRFDLLDPLTLPESNWWAPTREIETFTDAREAMHAAGDPDFALPKPADIPPGYVLANCQVTREDLRDEVNLVLTYTDGIDDFFVWQASNVPPPAIPALSGSSDGYSIAYYRDRNIAQLMFHLRSTRTMVIGRAGQFLLYPFTASMLRTALGR